MTQVALRGRMDGLPVVRVARLMGVTRMTIYNRLRRARVQRKRVPKASRRGRRAPRIPPPDFDT